MPNTIISIFIELGMDVALFMSFAVGLFALIRGGAAIFKVASKFLGVSGA